MGCCNGTFLPKDDSFIKELTQEREDFTDLSLNSPVKGFSESVGQTRQSKNLIGHAFLCYSNGLPKRVASERLSDSILKVSFISN